MQGYAYTIFAGDQIEKFDLEVLGIMPNFLGPRQSIILVQLKGPKVEHTGVVAGMSGSPVYLDGKLAGALSLKLGVFTKEPIAGVTPIADVLNPPVQNNSAQNAASRKIQLSNSPATRPAKSTPPRIPQIISPRNKSPCRPGPLSNPSKPLWSFPVFKLRPYVNFLRNCRATVSSPLKVAPPRRARMTRN